MMRKFSTLFGIAFLASQLTVCAQSPNEHPPAGAAEKIAAALPEKPLAKPRKNHQILVFSRTKGYRHGSIPTGKLLMTELGKKTGAFTPVISDDLDNFLPKNIKKFDAILFLSTTMNPFDGDPRELTLKKSLMDYISQGGGFMGIHAATDTFYEWADYGKMIGGYFDGHPWTADKDVYIYVEPGKEKHPLAVMFGGKPLEFKEEIYQFKDPYDSSKYEMLLRLDPEKSAQVQGKHRKDNDYGVSWAKYSGKGRVFYTSLGHNDHIYWNPKIILHYLGGLQWVLGDLEAPVKQ